VAAFTCIWTAEGWPYLAVADLFSRRVVGWSMKSEMTSQLVIDASAASLDAAIPARQEGGCFAPLSDVARVQLRDPPDEALDLANVTAQQLYRRFRIPVDDRLGDLLVVAKRFLTAAEFRIGDAA
jgi:hypothetical protein